MYKQKQFLGLFIFLFALFSKGFSQITVSPANQGCPPFSVVFTGPAGAVNPFWNLGPTQGTSNLPSASVIYTATGVYVVTFTALVGGNPVSYSAAVTVLQPPSGNFTFSQPSTHCAPMPVSFNGTGAGAGGTYKWVFGDLSPFGTTASVNHTYTSANNFLPSLILTAANGCTAVATPPSPSIISVSSPPVIQITSSAGFSGCNPPFVTAISGSNTSSGSPLAGGNLNFNWSFSGGSPSTANAVNAGAISFSSGQNTINVTVTDNNQCSNTASALVTVMSPSLSVSIQPTICISLPYTATVSTSQAMVYFTLPTAPTATSYIHVPNSVIVDSLPPISTPGLHNVIAYVVAGPGCSAVQVTKTVFVEQVTASFSLVPPYNTCDSILPASAVNLSTNNSGNTMTYAWSVNWFPNNATFHSVPLSTVITTPANFNFTLSQGSANPYTVYSGFLPSIQLVATSNSTAQCSDLSIHANHMVMRPTAKFATDKKQGCSPLVVTFTSTSLSNPFYPIPPTNYTWCNGASPPTFSVGVTTASFTYTPGTYMPYLIIQTVGGCIDYSYRDTITVVTPPNVTATFPSIVCAGQAAMININGSVNSSVPSSTAITHWHVDTDDHFFSGCITNKNPVFPFTHVGIHNVTVTAVQAGCEGSQVIPQTISVLGPAGKFRFETNCDVNKSSVSFSVHLQSASSATLFFGDGPASNVVISANPAANTNYFTTHIYPGSGNYTGTLVSVGNTGCAAYTFTQVVKIRYPKARITYHGQALPSLPTAIACTKTRYDFDASTSTDNLIGCGSGFTWFLASPVHALPPIMTGFPRIPDPNPLILPPPPPPLPAVQCTTCPYIVDPIMLDTFRVTGIYTITLMVKDENGCQDTMIRKFRISSAEPVFTITPNPVCFNAGTVQLTNNSQAFQVFPDVINNYTLSYGDQSPTLLINPPNVLSSAIHPIVNGFSPFSIFNSMLIAKNSLGCIDTGYVKWQVNKPYPNFNTSNLFPCIRQNSFNTISFAAATGYATYSVSYGEPPGTPVWVTTSTYVNANHTYAVPGVYAATMTVLDNISCKATQVLTITAIGQPTASLFFPPNGNNFFCTEDTRTVSSTSNFFVNPINTYAWGYSTPSTTLTPFNSTLTSVQPFLPRGVSSVSLNVYVTINGINHCESKAVAQTTVFTPSANIVLSPTILCLGDNLQASIEIINDVAGWKWVFGDNVPQPAYALGSPTTQVYPYTIYPTSSTTGSAVVQLLYSAAAGLCPTVIAQAIQVIRVDADFKQIRDKYAHCMGLTDTFINTTKNPLDLKYKFNWSFGDGSVSATGSISSTTYKSPGVYTVSFTTQDEQYSCIGTAIKQVTVFPSPKANLVITQTLSCPNASFEISGSGSPGVSGPVSGTLTASTGTTNLSMSANNDFTTAASSSVTTTYTLKVTDTNGCESEPATDIMNIVAPAPNVNWDTLVVIGEHTPLNAYISPGFTYTWSPLIVNLNCTECFIPNPISSTTVNVTYTVLVEDELKCSIVKSFYTVMINPKVTLDVPTAFTPNGDGTNDIIYAAGWGLKKLIYFRIYNRWGQLLFDSNDLKLGWDGIYNGVPQNMETYVYQVSAETYLSDQPVLSKSGTFKLIR